MDISDVRSRLFLILPDAGAASFKDAFKDALQGGDVACLLLPSGCEADLAADYVRIAHGADCAVLVTDDTQLMGRVGADGVHLSSPAAIEKSVLAKHQATDRIVGCGGPFTRHSALEAAERGFDYLFFGRLDRDLDEDTHPKVMKMAAWWAQIMTVPCVAMAGTNPESADLLAEAGAEFVGLREQVFESTEPAKAVADINRRFSEIAERRLAEMA